MASTDSGAVSFLVISYSTLASSDWFGTYCCELGEVSCESGDVS